MRSSRASSEGLQLGLYLTRASSEGASDREDCASSEEWADRRSRHRTDLCVSDRMTIKVRERVKGPDGESEGCEGRE